MWEGGIAIKKKKKKKRRFLEPTVILKQEKCKGGRTLRPRALRVCGIIVGRASEGLKDGARRRFRWEVRYDGREYLKGWGRAVSRRSKKKGA